MTAEEMLYRAEVGYDIITGHAAEGITKKEWSLFLTEAQLDLVKAHLPVKSTEISFEKTELISEQFSELVSDAVTVSGSLSTKISINQIGGITDKSVFFDLPSDFLYGLYGLVSYRDDSSCEKEEKVIVYDDKGEIVFLHLYSEEIYNLAKTWTNTEKLTYLDNNPSPDMIHYEAIGGGVTATYYNLTKIPYKAKIKPISHNYYAMNKGNDFKKPFHELAWRIVAKSENDSLRHEIIPYKPVKDYYLRYLKMPNPIIIFDEEYEDDTDTIQGVVLDDVFNSGNSIDTELSESFCDNIIRQAISKAQIAIGDSQAVQLGGMTASVLN